MTDQVAEAWEDYLEASEWDTAFCLIIQAGGMLDALGRWALADRAAELGMPVLEAYLRQWHVWGG